MTSGKAVKGSRMMLIKDNATSALEAVSSFPVRTYTPNMAKETCRE